MTKLELVSLAGALAPPQTGAWRVMLADPARSVMTDFREHGIVSVRGEQQIDAALEHMRHAGVRSAFVLDDPRERVLGLITAYDIMGEKPLRFEQGMSVSRGAVHVRDIMEHVGQWTVLGLAHVERATVGDLLDAFKRSGRTHLPVVEHEPTGPRLRGVFSSSKVLRLTADARGVRGTV